MKNIVYFDLETQKAANEVGGWGHISDMLMSIGVTYSTTRGDYRIYGEKEVDALITELQRADLVVGFNNLRFDYEVLHGYTPLDLRRERRVGDVLAELDAIGVPGIDTCYLPAPAPGVEQPMATIVDPGSGRRLDVWTDQPGIQCYTGQFLESRPHPPYAGLCLEPQRLPDSPNRPDFPSAVLRPDEVYRARSVVRFSVE